ncbi:rab5 GDP/GTP exchange factor-like isoform X2 [Uloborus diversus]|uniref:rab5 GDP/GTP exchange factor-like isoform X2 n=1 Tax=Uloborus diversus TaxID=327109 RepID=UPI00240A7AE7|nr:rab5 GDP/GTP exchange factor-like isoform X2 [Uloborus diversus]
MSDFAPSSNKPKASVLYSQELKCKNKCGFYGNREWQGYCSQCYRELNQKIKPVHDSKGPSKKVVRSYSDAHESSISLGFSKFEEKKKQHSEKRSKTIKSIIKRGHTSKESSTQSPSKDIFTIAEIHQLSKDLQLKDSVAKDVFKQIQTQLDIMSKFYDKSIDEQSEVMQDFYNFMSNRLETHPAYQDLNSEQVDVLIDKIEEKLMIHMHTTVYHLITSENEEKDLALQNRIRALNWITPQRLGMEINESLPGVRALVDDAINDIVEMDSKIAPQEKISCIVKCSRNIFNIINLCQGVTASADEFLPAMVYIVLRANPTRLQSNIKYITSYSIPIRLRSGEGAYYFTNLCCAVQFIEDLTSESLNLSNEEFERYLSGEVPAGLNEENATESEALRMMLQRISTLDKIQEKLDDITVGMVDLKDKIAQSEDVKKKPSTPLIINPKPYVIPAGTNLNLIPKMLRNRVVMEDSPDDILVDIDSKPENGDKDAQENSAANTATQLAFGDNPLTDFHSMSLTESKVLCPDSHVTMMQPLHVTLPSQANGNNCKLFSEMLSENSKAEPDVSQTENFEPVINIKDLEYPTEIFPDSEESSRTDELRPVDSLDYMDNVQNSSVRGLVDPLSPEASFLEENLNLPPPLLPVVVQNVSADGTNDRI